MPDLPPGIWNRLLDGLAGQAALIGQLVVILVVAWLAWRFSSASIHRVVRALVDRETADGTGRELSAVEAEKRIQTIDSLATRTVRILILLIAGATILETFRISVLPAIAGFGIVGIAVGFGAQHLVRDYLNGVLILVENQFSKGDVVEIAGVAGTVEDFSLRRTTLRDLDGRVHTVPNGSINVASNLTRAWARINLDVTVSHDADLERAVEVVNAVGEALDAEPAWTKRILETPRVDRVEAVTDLGVTLKVLGTVLAADRWSATGELRRRIYLALREAGIGIPGRPGPAGPAIAVVEPPMPQPQATAEAGAEAPAEARDGAGGPREQD